MSPWLSSVMAATGLDPRELVSGTTFLLLDTSSSMSGEPIREAIEGAQRFNAECVSSAQSVGLISFSTTATMMARPSRSGIAGELSAVKCSGSTNMAAALELASTDLLQINSRRTIVIATDGEPDDRDATLRAADRAKAAGIRILTIGTASSDTAFLARIASSADFAVAVSAGKLGKAIAASAQLLLR